MVVYKLLSMGFEIRVLILNLLKKIVQICAKPLYVTFSKYLIPQSPYNLIFLSSMSFQSNFILCLYFQISCLSASMYILFLSDGMSCLSNCLVCHSK